MNAQTVVVSMIMLVIIATISIRNRNRGEPEEEEHEDYDAANLIEAIGALYELAEQLENADRMIADLNACDPYSLLRGFRAEWHGIDGKNRHIDFLADGRNGATAGLRQAASEQREEINAEIIGTVRAMSAALDSGLAPALTVDAVEKTVDETMPEATAGEL